MPISRMSAKGEILIPEQLWNNLGFKPGGKVQLIEESGRLVITPAAEDPVVAATGFLTGKFSLIRDLRREHRAELAHKIRRKLSPNKRPTTPAR